MLSVLLSLNNYGLDVCHEFNSSWYNDHVDENHLDSKLNKLDNNKYSILIGNTKVLWDYFIKWIKQDQNRIDIDNPFDAYVTYAIEETLKCLKDENTKYQLYWSYHVNKDEGLVSMARVSSCSGLCYLDDTTHLAIHPIFGTWVSFRCVIVTSLQYPDLDHKPISLPCPISNDSLDKAKELFEEALSKSNQVDNYLYWVKVRECVNSDIQQQYRFSNNQIEYHYCDDRKSVLNRLRE